MKADLPNVRIARPEDENELMEMCRRLHQENGLHSLNDDKVRAYLRANENGSIIGVIGEPGVIEASICLVCETMYYTDDWQLAELWNYVQPEYRKSRNAEALIEFAKDTSDRMHRPFVTGIITNKQMAGKVRLYRRMLGPPAGAFFVYNSPWKSEPMEDRSDLVARLKEFAQKCNDGKVSSGVARKQVAPLLREAIEAISREDNLWGPSRINGGNGDIHAGAT